MPRGTVQHLVVMKSQLEQMAQYGQVLIATSGVMIGVIGGLHIAAGEHSTNLFLIASVAALVVSMFFGFFAYGFVINSFVPAVTYEAYNGVVAKEIIGKNQYFFGGGEALVVKTDEFKSIRIFNFIQFMAMLAGTILLVAGLVIEAGT